MIKATTSYQPYNNYVFSHDPEAPENNKQMIKAHTADEAHLEYVSWRHNRESGTLEIDLQCQDHRKRFRRHLKTQSGISYNPSGNPIIIRLVCART